MKRNSHKRQHKRYTLADIFCFYLPRLGIGLIIGTVLLYQWHPTFKQYTDYHIQQIANEN